MMQKSSFELVSHRQRAGRIAIEGEREIAAMRRQPLSRGQQAQVLKDAADLVRGLVVLDVRCKNVPGWRFLEEKGRLLTAASAVSDGLDATDLDASVDHLGWRPSPGGIEGPALPGLAGVLQTQHNVVVHLGHFPSASNLRHVLVAQADISKSAARLSESAAPSLVNRFAERAELYRELVRASRTLGGIAGGGRGAALESSNAARRLRIGKVEGERLAGAVERLSHLNDRVDVRIAAAVEHEFRERLYFLAITLPCLDTQAREGVFRPTQKWITVESPMRANLLVLAREKLGPVRRGSPDTASPLSVQSRAAYEAALSAGRRTAGRFSPNR